MHSKWNHQHQQSSHWRTNAAKQQWIESNLENWIILRFVRFQTVINSLNGAIFPTKNFPIFMQLSLEEDIWCLAHTIAIFENLIIHIIEKLLLRHNTAFDNNFVGEHHLIEAMRSFKYWDLDLSHWFLFPFLFFDLMI